MLKQNLSCDIIIKTIIFIFEKVFLMKLYDNIQITSNGIKYSLRKYKSLKSISEYIWNGFDAKATQVYISASINELEKIYEISVTDNGHGIENHLLKTKFKPFFQSEKVYDPEIKHSATHGKNGVGRLTFFTFATMAEWVTVYEKEGKNYQYKITAMSDSLDTYEASEETEVDIPTGTKVSFYNVNDSELSIESIKQSLAKEFCWFLELHKNDGYKIFINGEELSYEHLVIERKDHKFEIENTSFSFDTSFVCWSSKLTEYSKYYYLKTSGEEIAKENTTFNNKGDSFYHSVFIKSNLFDNFSFSELPEQVTLVGPTLKTKQSDEFRYCLKEVNKILLDIRKPFLKQHVSKVVESLEVLEAFPNFKEGNPFDEFRKSQIEEMIGCLYIAQPKMFSSAMNKEQKKTFIRLLDLIAQTGEIDSLFNILQEILDMNESEREDLSDMLKYTRLSSITKTIKLLSDRYKAVNDLKRLVFEEELAANEVDHIQKMIEKHYWLFGEQYNLVTAAEPNFSEALRRYVHYLHKEYGEDGVDHPDKLKQMDIFAVRQDFTNGKINNIVVELKHPKVSLGETQLSQIKKYMNVILSVDQFNAPNMTWEFYLVGNKFNSNGYMDNELKNNEHHGEKSLVFKVNNYKIYVKTWSEVFADFELRYNHLTKILEMERDKLQADAQTAAEIVNAQETNTAVAPKEMS